MPCCWLEGEEELAVAMVAGVQKGEEEAGCWGEEVAVASCPLEVAADLWRKKSINSSLFATQCKVSDFQLVVMK